MSNTPNDSPRNLLTSSLPERTGPFRSLSAKRLRDPSHRKSVSFNDVPIVHEVPSHDTTRNSNADIYRSWTFTETTSPISVISPFSSSQILPPFNSTSVTAQKFHANRLSSALYSSTNHSTLSRFSDWPARTKTVKTPEETREYSPPLIVVHKPNEQTNKSSLLIENTDEKKHSHRSAIIPDAEHYRNLPFTYAPLSESANAYTSMLSNHLIQPNEQTPNGSTRATRARSATLPITVTNNSSIRTNDNISITSFRPVTSSSRTILKPATIAFHGSAGGSNSKPPALSPRSHSFAVHSRIVSSPHRPLSSTTRQATPSATLSRSRSANISSTKRHLTSPAVLLDGETEGRNSNQFYTSTKRNSNVRPTYSSHSMHHVLLPANID